MIVTSVSGSSSRPNDFEYAVAIAFFRRGRPYLIRQSAIHQFVCPPGRIVPWSENTGYNQPCRELPWQHRARIWVGCSHWIQENANVNPISSHWVEGDVQEPLSHVYNWLHWGSGGCFIDDGPDPNNSLSVQSSEIPLNTRNSLPNILSLSCNSGCGLERVCFGCGGRHVAMVVVAAG